MSSYTPRYGQQPVQVSPFGNANASGLAGMHGDVHNMWHVKGNLFLTGNEWSGTRVPDDRGYPSGYGYRFTH